MKRFSALRSPLYHLLSDAPWAKPEKSHDFAADRCWRVSSGSAVTIDPRHSREDADDHVHAMNVTTLSI
jgi:hypothetical protein